MLDGKVLFGQSVKCTWFQPNRFHPQMAVWRPGFSYDDLFRMPYDGNGKVNSSNPFPANKIAATTAHNEQDNFAFKVIAE